MYHIKTAEAAKGKWRGILLEFGIPEKLLINKHGPCPLCGGKDRFRFDNNMGSGSYICGQCGAGDGMALAKAFTGMEFRELADKIDRIVNNVKIDSSSSISTPISDEDRRLKLRAVYAATSQVVKGDLADKYLRSRGLGENEYPKSLRLGSAIQDGDGGLRPCMVATVQDGSGKPVSLHRTFLRPDGEAKAEMIAPRKLMPGSLPDGACIKLSDGETEIHLGIAEGIETAMSAGRLFEIPVWAVLNAVMMEKWKPPVGCERVAIFGDNDKNFRGQMAAYTLANRLALVGLDVEVSIPPETGTDWNDSLAKERTSL